MKTHLHVVKSVKDRSNGCQPTRALRTAAIRMPLRQEAHGSVECRAVRWPHVAEGLIGEAAHTSATAWIRYPWLRDHAAMFRQMTVVVDPAGVAAVLAAAGVASVRAHYFAPAFHAFRAAAQLYDVGRAQAIHDSAGVLDMELWMDLAEQQPDAVDMKANTVDTATINAAMNRTSPLVGQSRPERVRRLARAVAMAVESGVAVAASWMVDRHFEACETSDPSSSPAARALLRHCAIVWRDDAIRVLRNGAASVRDLESVLHNLRRSTETLNVTGEPDRTLPMHRALERVLAELGTAYAPTRPLEAALYTRLAEEAAASDFDPVRIMRDCQRVDLLLEMPSTPEERRRQLDSWMQLALVTIRVCVGEMMVAAAIEARFGPEDDKQAKQASTAALARSLLPQLETYTQFAQAIGDAEAKLLCIGCAHYIRDLLLGDRQAQAQWRYRMTSLGTAIGRAVVQRARTIHEEPLLAALYNFLAGPIGPVRV